MREVRIRKTSIVAAVAAAGLVGALGVGAANADPLGSPTFEGTFTGSWHYPDGNGDEDTGGSGTAGIEDEANPSGEQGPTNRDENDTATDGIGEGEGAADGNDTGDSPSAVPTTPAAAPGADTVPVTQANSSLPADRLNAAFTDSTGRKSTYHLFTSKVTGPVKGLAIYLDGDGMYGHKNPNGSWALGGSKGVPAEAGKRGYATLSVLTPSRDGTFWTDGKANATYVAELIKKIKAEVGVAPTWLITYSGGSQLATKWLVPNHADVFAGGGGMAITGGGGRPPGNATIAAGLKSNFQGFWYTGSRDNGGDYDALSDARRGSDWYKGKLASTVLEVPQGVTHSDLGGKFGTILGTQLDKYPTGTPTSTTTSPSSTTTAPTSTTTSPSSSTTTTGAPTDIPTTTPTGTPTGTPTETPAPIDEEELGGLIQAVTDASDALKAWWANR